MTPNTYTDLLAQTFGLLNHAISSAVDLVGFLFVGFLKISPLPDEVDFLLVCLLLIWLGSLIVRLFRGMQR